MVVAYIWVIFMWKGSSQSASAGLNEKTIELLYTQRLYTEGLLNFCIPKVQNPNVLHNQSSL